MSYGQSNSGLGVPGPPAQKPDDWWRQQADLADEASAARARPFITAEEHALADRESAAAVTALGSHPQQATGIFGSYAEVSVF